MVDNLISTKALAGISTVVPASNSPRRLGEGHRAGRAGEGPANWGRVRRPGFKSGRRAEGGGVVSRVLSSGGVCLVVSGKGQWNELRMGGAGPGGGVVRLMWDHKIVRLSTTAAAGWHSAPPWLAREGEGRPRTLACGAATTVLQRLGTEPCPSQKGPGQSILAGHRRASGLPAIDACLDIAISRPGRSGRPRVKSSSLLGAAICTFHCAITNDAQSRQLGTLRNAMHARQDGYTKQTRGKGVTLSQSVTGC